MAASPRAEMAAAPHTGLARTCFFCLSEAMVSYPAASGISICANGNCKTKIAIVLALLPSSKHTEDDPETATAQLDDTEKVTMHCYKNATRVSQAVNSMADVFVPTSARDTVFTSSENNELPSSTRPCTTLVSVDAAGISLQAQNSGSAQMDGIVTPSEDGVLHIHDPDTGVQTVVYPAKNDRITLETTPCVRLRPLNIVQQASVPTRLSYLLPGIPWETGYDILVAQTGKSMRVTTVVNITNVPMNVVPKRMRVTELHFVMTDIAGLQPWEQSSHSESHNQRRIYAKSMAPTMMAPPAAAPQGYSGELEFATAAGPASNMTYNPDNLPASLSTQLRVLNAVDLGPRATLRLPTHSFKMDCQLLGVVDMRNWDIGPQSAVVQEAIYIKRDLVKASLRDLISGVAHVTLEQTDGIDERAHNVAFLPECLPGVSADIHPAIIHLGAVAGMRVVITAGPTDIDKGFGTTGEARTYNRKITITYNAKVANPLARSDLEVELWLPAYSEKDKSMIEYEGATLLPFQREDEPDWITGDAGTRRVRVPLVTTDAYNATYTVVSYGYNE